MVAGWLRKVDDLRVAGGSLSGSCVKVYERGSKGNMSRHSTSALSCFDIHTHRDVNDSISVGLHLLLLYSTMFCTA
jgi:hypothetical protein